MDPDTDLSAPLDLNGLTSQASGPGDLHDEDLRQEVETSLRSIPGVLAARLIPGMERSVDELHILSSTSKSPKAAVRDVQSMLVARFGITIDHRVVSVVQIDEGEPGIGGAPRPAIGRVAATQEGLSTHVTVELIYDGAQHVGSSTGPASAAGRRRATARAALEAVRPLLEDDCVVEIEGVDITEVVGRMIAIALVHFNTSRGERLTCGSAVLSADESHAVAKAVLDAVNRSIKQR